MPVLCDCTLIMCALCFVAPLQKNAIAVAHCKKGKGVLNINGYPIDGLLPESMRYKVFEPVLLVGNDKFKDVDIRVKVRGGGNTSQIFGEHFFVVSGVCVHMRGCWVGKSNGKQENARVGCGSAARGRQGVNTGGCLKVGFGVWVRRASQVPNVAA